MMLPAGVVQSIDANIVDIDNAWIFADADIWSQDYAEVLLQPISVEAVDINDLRFKATSVVLEIRATTDPASAVIWSGYAETVDDAGGGGVIGLESRISCGVIDPVPPVFIDNGNGTATIFGFRCAIRPVPDYTQSPSDFEIAPATLTFPDGVESYACVAYIAGTPTLYVETNKYAINGSDVVLIFVVWRTGNELHSTSTDSRGIGLADKIAGMITRTKPYSLMYGQQLTLGVVTTPAVRTVTIAAAVMYSGVDAVPLVAVNSSDPAQRFTRVAPTAGVYGFVNQTQLDNTNYSDGTNVVALGANRYSPRWVYRTVGDDAQAFYALGGEYTNIASAQAAPIPTGLPIVVQNHAVLVGRIIIRAGVDTPVQIDQVESTTFSTSTANMHNNLDGLQGTGPDYYHMDVTRWTNTGNGPWLPLTADIDNTLTGKLYSNGGAEFSGGKLFLVQQGSGTTLAQTYTYGGDLGLAGDNGRANMRIMGAIQADTAGVGPGLSFAGVATGVGPSGGGMLLQLTTNNGLDIYSWDNTAWVKKSQINSNGMIAVIGGTAAGFLKANGTIDTTGYLTAANPTFTGTLTGPSAILNGANQQLFVGSINNSGRIAWARGSDGNTAGEIGFSASSTESNQFRYWTTGGSGYHSWWTNRNGNGPTEIVRFENSGKLVALFGADVTGSVTVSNGTGSAQMAPYLNSTAAWFGYAGYNLGSSTGAGFWAWSDGGVGLDATAGRTATIRIAGENKTTVDANGLTVYGILTLPELKLRTYTANSAFGAMYGASTTPSDINYTLIWAKDGTITQLNGTSSVYLNVNNVATITLTSGNVNLRSGVALQSNGTTVIDSSRNGSFANLTASGILTLPDINIRTYTVNTYGAFYGSSVTPSATNYGLIIAKDGSTAQLNGTTASYLNVNDAAVVKASVGKAEIVGSLSMNTGDISFANSGTNIRGVYGTVGDNDSWRVVGGATATNAGYLEIATANDGNEPIYFRQYSGTFASPTSTRTLTLMDSAGNTQLPGQLTLTRSGSDTYTVTAMIADATTGLVIERGRSSNSSSAAIRSFTISQRGGGTNYFEVADGTTYSRQLLSVDSNIACTGYVKPGGVEFSAYGTCGIYNGNADAVSYTQYNFKIKSWWGIGFESYDAVTRCILDTRTGNLSTLGTVTASSITASSATFNGDISFSNSGTTLRAIKGTMGDNDFWRVGGGATAVNAGYMEIATADDGNEPIYVRQYTGVFTTLTRTLTLLDASGDTTTPGSLTVGGAWIQATGSNTQGRFKSQFSGNKASYIGNWPANNWWGIGSDGTTTGAKGYLQIGQCDNDGIWTANGIKLKVLGDIEAVQALSANVLTVTTGAVLGGTLKAYKANLNPNIDNNGPVLTIDRGGASQAMTRGIKLSCNSAVAGYANPRIELADGNSVMAVDNYNQTFRVYASTVAGSATVMLSGNAAGMTADVPTKINEIKRDVNSVASTSTLGGLTQLLYVGSSVDINLGTDTATVGSSWDICVIGTGSRIVTGNLPTTIYFGGSAYFQSYINLTQYRTYRLHKTGSSTYFLM